MSATANSALLKRFVDEVLTGHNLAVLDDVFHEDYVEDDPPPGMAQAVMAFASGWPVGLRRSPTWAGQSKNKSQMNTRSGAGPPGRGPTKARFSAFPRQERRSPWPRGPSTGSRTERLLRAGLSWTH